MLVRPGSYRQACLLAAHIETISKPTDAYIYSIILSQNKARKGW